MFSKEEYLGAAYSDGAIEKFLIFRMG